MYMRCGFDFIFPRMRIAMEKLMPSLGPDMNDPPHPDKCHLFLQAPIMCRHLQSAFQVMLFFLG